jgi:hypothetical protein
MIKLSHCNPARIDLLTTVVFSTASFTTGIAQLSIGGLMKGDKTDSYQGVFIVLIILSVLGFVTVTIRSFIVYKNITSNS